MKNVSNLKDTLTTICGLIFTIGSVLLTVNGVPENSKVIVGIAVAVSGGIIGWLTGKAPDGAAKTDNRLKDQNVQAK